MYSYADRFRAVELYIRLSRPFASWVSHKECAQGLVPRVLAASPPAYSAGSSSAEVFRESEAGGT
jgi:hypothetical protein